MANTGTKKVEMKDVELVSRWQCTKSGKKYKLPKNQPTTDVYKTNIMLNMEMTAKVTSITVYATIDKYKNVKSNISLLKINGKQITGEKGKVSITSVKDFSLGRGGSIEIKIEFKASGTNKDDKEHEQKIYLKNVYADIAWEASTVHDNRPFFAREQDIGSYGVTNADQSVLILNLDPSDTARKNEYYLFDGVTKIGASYSAQMDENAKGNDKKYRYATKNLTDKLTLDVVMSNVHNTVSDLTNFHYVGISQDTESPYVPKSYRYSWDNAGSRCALAAQKLHYVKEGRDLMTIFTPQTVYRAFILTSVTINQDDNSPYGWTGQLTFEHVLETQTKKKESGGGKVEETIVVPSIFAPKHSNNTTTSTRTSTRAVEMLA